MIGLDLGPIPWSAFDRYAIRHGIDDVDEFERFCHLMRALDNAYLEHHDSLKQKPEKK